MCRTRPIARRANFRFTDRRRAARRIDALPRTLSGGPHLPRGATQGTAATGTSVSKRASPTQGAEPGLARCPLRQLTSAVPSELKSRHRTRWRPSSSSKPIGYGCGGRTKACVIKAERHGGSDGARTPAHRHRPRTQPPPPTGRSKRTTQRKRNPVTRHGLQPFRNAINGPAVARRTDHLPPGCPRPHILSERLEPYTDPHPHARPRRHRNPTLPPRCHSMHLEVAECT